MSAASANCLKITSADELAKVGMERMGDFTATHGTSPDRGASYIERGDRFWHRLAHFVVHGSLAIIVTTVTVTFERVGRWTFASVRSRI